jgi:DNA-binding transcriptional ArsR family regulator
MSPAAAPPALAVIREPGQALALLDPERRRLVEALAQGPDSASGLARRLGEKRQRLNYHLRVLEAAGLVELAEERNRGNVMERVLRLTARRFVLDPGAVGKLAESEPAETGDRFSGTYLLALAARVVREMADLLERAATRRARLATASVNTMVRLGRPADFEALVRDLTGAVAKVVAQYHTERGEGRWFRVIAGAYPGPVPAPSDTEATHERHQDSPAPGSS